MIIGSHHFKSGFNQKHPRMKQTFFTDTGFNEMNKAVPIACSRGNNQFICRTRGTYLFQLSLVLSKDNRSGIRGGDSTLNKLDHMRQSGDVFRKVATMTASGALSGAQTVAPFPGSQCRGRNTEFGRNCSDGQRRIVSSGKHELCTGHDHS